MCFQHLMTDFLRPKVKVKFDPKVLMYHCQFCLSVPMFPPMFSYSCDWISKCNIEPLEWVHYWNKWHWTLPFFMDLALLNNIGKIQNGQYLRNEENLRDMNGSSAFYSSFPSFWCATSHCLKILTLTYLLTPTNLWPWRSNWGQKVKLWIGST